MSTGNDERRPCQDAADVETTTTTVNATAPVRQDAGDTAAYDERPDADFSPVSDRVFRQLDAEYVRRSFRRSWDPEIRRLRRLLREVA